jgi:hypothetical protein
MKTDLIQDNEFWFFLRKMLIGIMIIIGHFDRQCVYLCLKFTLTKKQININ